MIKKKENSEGGGASAVVFAILLFLFLIFPLSMVTCSQSPARRPKCKLKHDMQGPEKIMTMKIKGREAQL